MPNLYLSTRVRRLIERIRDSEEQELVCAHPGGWWVGDSRAWPPDCFALLRLVLIRREDSSDDFERYTLYPQTLAMLADDLAEPDFIVALRNLNKEKAPLEG